MRYHVTACTLLVLLAAVASAELSPRRQTTARQQRSFRRRAVDSSDVTLYLYTKSNPSKEVIKIGDPSSSPSFNASNPTRIVIHGWQSSYLVMHGFATAYLKAGDYNVILVDYSGLASSTYPSAILYSEQVADYLKLVVDDLMENRGLKLSEVFLVGHSLGGQLAGLLGSRLGGNAAQIVGLDPAGPSFELFPASKRLDPSDAKLVQVIHTNGGGLGFYRPCGDVDFFVNGGSKQAGCSPLTDVSGICSHLRVLTYYTESINSKDFVAVQCDGPLNYNIGRFKSNPQNILGEHVNESPKGVFCLNTNTRAPFAQGSP